MTTQAVTSPESSPPAASAEEAANGNARRRAMLILVVVFLGGAALWGAYWVFVARWQETTDDAYVAGHVVQITPQVGGTVRAVLVDDTDRVAAGETLVELDDADSRVALNQAEAALAQIVREVRARYVNNAALRAQVAARQSEVDRLNRDLARRAPLAESGAVPKEEVEHTRESLKAASANLAAAREQLAANRALTGGVDIEQHPAIMQAAARFEEAWLAWSRSHITAPVAGQVAKRNTQVGQRVAAGAPLMAVIPLEQLWVDANFKEVQLDKMRIGQPVTLTADVYGADIRYRGRVAGFAAGTGSAFALLPAQNATGNWIKVVQRVPVRVELEAADLQAHPLRIGLSMRVKVDTHDLRDRSGVALPPLNMTDTQPADARHAVAARLNASDTALVQARARIAEIIRQHDVASPVATAAKNLVR
ncbi:MAG: HlyD family efflux transporter periplasmic adaptor subunit [Zoogloeaceae bacterium]|nr:HlyD family efflux transporter periplasmic adaptor subunit [Zoogloeaceae bacterium]